MRTAKIWLVLVFILGVMMCSAAVQKRPYVFAVIPAAPPVATHTLWAPFIDRLSRDTGVAFQLKVYERMSEFERDITAGGLDFLFANPFQTVVAHRAHGYRPIVRGGKPVSVVVFVPADSPIRSVDDLSRKKVAFVGNKNL